MADLNVTVYTSPYGIVGPAGADGALSTSGVIRYNGFTGNVQGVSSWNGKTGALQGVCTMNGLVGTVGLSAGININIATIGNTLTVATTSNVVKTDTAQTFTQLQQFNGFSAADIYLARFVDTPPASNDVGTPGNLLFSFEGGILYMYYCIQSGVWRRFTASSY